MTYSLQRSTSALMALCCFSTTVLRSSGAFTSFTYRTAPDAATSPSFVAAPLRASLSTDMFSDYPPPEDDSRNRRPRQQHPYDYNHFSMSPGGSNPSTPLPPDADDQVARRHAAEFEELEPLVDTVHRAARKERDNEAREQYVTYGNELWNLRKQMQTMSAKLVAAINAENIRQEDMIRQSLREMERQDPELQYKLCLEEAHKAKVEGRHADAEEHEQRALAARNCLPQYNLDGLWVGKYGHHGYELINITYAGDVLIAYKVTGDQNVPRGEITFQVDLSPIPTKSLKPPQPPLQPIMLTSKAARKWGTDQLPRTRGLGQVAESGFNNNQWMEGQLIIIGEEYFSFAWVPIEHQIFFGRPSPELTLKMLRECGSSDITVPAVWDKPPSLDDDISVLKNFVSSCLEKTSEVQDEQLRNHDDDPFSCIWHGTDTEECYFQ